MYCARVMEGAKAWAFLVGDVMDRTSSLAKQVDLGAVVEQGVVAEGTEGINVEASRKSYTLSIDLKQHFLFPSP